MRKPYRGGIRQYRSPLLSAKNGCCQEQRWLAYCLDLCLCEKQPCWIQSMRSAMSKFAMALGPLMGRAELLLERPAYPALQAQQNLRPLGLEKPVNLESWQLSDPGTNIVQFAVLVPESC
jgi:hypothetical protein